MATVAKHDGCQDVSWGELLMSGGICLLTSTMTQLRPKDLVKPFIIMACLFLGPAYLHWGSLPCKLGLHAVYYAKTECEILSISETFI